MISLRKMGDLGDMGLMGSEIWKIISEQNKNSSTLFKFISEIIFLSRSYLLVFRGRFSLLQNIPQIPMNKGHTE